MSNDIEHTIDFIDANPIFTLVASPAKINVVLFFSPHEASSQLSTVGTIGAVSGMSVHVYKCH